MSEQQVIGRFEPKDGNSDKPFNVIVRDVTAGSSSGVKEDGTKYHVYDAYWTFVEAPPATHAPTLETMLAEWRDLEARAQAAQAEADALFEHAGQCHGEIVVRLAELGWGAPRMVPGEPVVTLDTSLDMSDWSNWQVGDIIRVLDDEGDSELRAGHDYPIFKIDDEPTTLPIQLLNDRTMWLYRESMLWISRPSTQP